MDPLLDSPNRVYNPRTKGLLDQQWFVILMMISIVGATIYFWWWAGSLIIDALTGVVTGL